MLSYAQLSPQKQDVLSILTAHHFISGFYLLPVLVCFSRAQVQCLVSQWILITAFNTKNEILLSLQLHFQHSTDSLMTGTLTHYILIPVLPGGGAGSTGAAF